MNEPLAPNDFATIRAGMEELRREPEHPNNSSGSGAHHGWGPALLEER
jgi:hypothetical protein